MRVLYNAKCPVCSAEIGHYAAYAARERLAIRFDDLNSEELKTWSVTADEAARRLHVLKDSEVYAGIPAFIVLWQDMPRYRWVARLVSAPGVFWLANRFYDYVLAPLIYRRHQRREATSTIC